MAQYSALKRNHKIYIHSSFKKGHMCLLSDAHQPEGRPDHYKDWTDDKMKKAMRAVEEGCSIRKAAEEHGIPRSTLHDRITGKVMPGSKSGPRKYLSTMEEEELVSFLAKCSSVGYGKTRAEVIALVQSVVDKKKIETQVSTSWLKSFTKRHPDLTLKTGESISRARQIGASIDNLESYFDFLEETLIENDLIHRPCQIFNTDETGVMLDGKPLKVLGTKAQKEFYSVSTGNKGQVTVLACVSAGGACIPPMIILNRKGLREGMTDGEIPGTLYAFSPKGWIDTELFENWFFHHFLMYAPPIRPLLLLLDGHSSHYGPAFVNKAAEEKVIVFCLPPHSTHRTQPLDKGAFSPLKRYWAEECHKFLSANPGKVITHYQFGAIFHNAWRRAMTPSNIAAGFQITGVYPLDRYQLLPREHLEDQSHSQHTVYIPFFTPKKRSRKISLPSVGQQQSKTVPEDDCSSDDSAESADTMPHDFETDQPFTHDELAKFSKRFEEGYDLKDDKRYNLWLKYRESHAVIPPLQTALTPFLTIPEVKYPDSSQHKPSARIITSTKYREQILEREQKKIQEIERKAQNKKEREQRRIEREQKQEERKRNQEKKKAAALAKDSDIEDCGNSKKTVVHTEDVDITEDGRDNVEDTSQAKRTVYTHDTVSKTICTRGKTKCAVGSRGKKNDEKSDTVSLRGSKTIAKENDSNSRARAFHGTTSKTATVVTTCSTRGKAIGKDKRTVDEDYKADDDKSVTVGKEMSASTEHTSDSRETDCSLKRCRHRNGIYWVCCSICSGWYHCICCNVPYSKARVPDYKFVCKSCKS